MDKSINELEVEIKKLSPDGEMLRLSDLAQATFAFNNKIRKRGLSASEIHFSRENLGRNPIWQNPLGHNPPGQKNFWTKSHRTKSPKIKSPKLELGRTKSPKFDNPKIICHNKIP